jgi:hypothetical protein
MVNENSGGQSFDLSGALDDLFDFEREMDVFTGVSIPRAADQMASAFEMAGDRIEQALGRAARSGKLDFEALVTGLLTDLARFGTQGILDQVLAGRGAGASQQAQPVSITMNLASGQDARSLSAAQGQIASVIAQAVQSGRRWS